MCVVNCTIDTKYQTLNDRLVLYKGLEHQSVLLIYLFFFSGKKIFNYLVLTS